MDHDDGANDTDSTGRLDPEHVAATLGSHITQTAPDELRKSFFDPRQGQNCHLSDFLGRLIVMVRMKNGARKTTNEGCSPAMHDEPMKTPMATHSNLKERQGCA